MADELISRQAAIEVVAGAERSLNAKLQHSPIKAKFADGLIRKLNEITAANAVEVGSCEGCYWRKIERYQKCACCRRNRHLKDCYCPEDWRKK